MRPLALGIALALAAGCADEPGPASAAPADAPVAAADAATPAAAGASTITLGSTEYRFTATRCDLSGESPDGMLLRGSGTAADEGPFTVMVERIKPGDIVFESVTLYFGSIVEGDMWVAKRGGLADGTWRAGDGYGGAVDGPLLLVEGDSLTARDEFKHETSGEARPGSLQATCPAEG